MIIILSPMILGDKNIKLMEQIDKDAICSNNYSIAI
jgi:hypothetical protein